MINILIPLAGKNQFFNEAEYPYPKPLIEINNKTMIEHVINNFNAIEGEKQFVFVVNSEDCKKYHLDNILNLLIGDSCKIIKLDNETKGAACSAMMAIEYINNDLPLIIANADQLFDDNLQDIIADFKGVDAGVITFKSIHPRWSYVRINSDYNIVETAEKRPLSKHVIAGFFYFAKGSDFINSAMNMIQKDVSVNDLYYISPTLNEMVLKNKKLLISEVDGAKYHTFYSPKKIQEYEQVTKC